MKTFNSKFLALVLAGGLAFTACDDDSPVTPEDNDVEITGLPATASIANLGTLGPVTVTITAGDGLDEIVVTKDGQNLETVDYDGETSATYNLSYTAVEADADKNIVFTIRAVDEDGDSETATHVLSVGAAPAATYSFRDISEDRDGVSYSQTEVSGTINQDVTFTNDKVWVLNGRVIVGAGSTLTIEEGTIIKGRAGQGALASVLLVARNAMIMAEGTAENPIVFTSYSDDINVGEFDSKNMDLVVDRGLWGGVLILGNAPISADAAEVQIEGIPVSVTEGLYGGSTSDDNSGVFKYVSIRYTGTQLSQGNELQGLTLGGVGSGTTIDNVESINSNDDGIEIFGGTVNLTNILIWGQDDDGYDIDQGWSGTIDNFVFIGGAGDHPLEIDGPEGSANGKGTLMNGSIRGVAESEFGDLRDGAQIKLMNIYFFDFKSGADLELDADGADDPNDNTKSLSNNPSNSDNYVNDVIEFSGLQFQETPNNGGTNFTLSNVFVDKFSLAPNTGNFDPNDSRTDADAKNQAAANVAKFANAQYNNMVVTSATVGADLTPFSWTLAEMKDQLAAFPTIQ
jgi:hypothetical protein